MAPRPDSKRRELKSFFSKIIRRVKQDGPSTPLFPLFSQLPAEIQIKIWQFFLHAPTTTPHTLHYRLYKHRAHSNIYGCKMQWTRCVDNTAAMQVNRLSRDVAWEYYLSLLGPTSITMSSSAIHNYPEIHNCFCKIGYEVPKGIAGKLETSPPEHLDVSLDRYLIVGCEQWSRWYMGFGHVVCTAQYGKHVYLDT